jgi:HPt (histidine-containing phosphotransfer) domain-containing protein
MSGLLRTQTGQTYRVVPRTAADGLSTYDELVPFETLGERLGCEAIDAAMLARAEAAVAKLALEFPDEVRSALGEIRAELRSDAPRQDAAYRLAHNLKGQGGTFGYPLVTLIAASLRRVLRQAFPSEQARRVTAAAMARLDAIVLALDWGRTKTTHPGEAALLAELSALTARLVP